MKSISKYIYLIGIACCFFAIFSCSDDDNTISNGIGSTIEHYECKKVSTFYVPHDSASIGSDIYSTIVHLDNAETNKRHELSATTSLKNNRLEVKMDIPNNVKIEDGTYNLSTYQR